MILSDATTPGQSGPGSDGNEEVLVGEESNPSAEMQSGILHPQQTGQN